MRINWEQSEKQRLFCELTGKADEILYGGAAGGGKSYVQCQDAFLYALSYPKSRQLLLRRTFPDLEKSIIRTTLSIYPKELCKYSAGNHVWRFQNGSVLDFGYCANEKDVYQYQSAEYDVIRFDELTHFSEKMYTYLISRLRGANPYPKAVKSSTNPGGIGHSWVKRRFIDLGEPGVIHRTKTGNTRVFIPSLVTENRWLMKEDPHYVDRLRELPKRDYEQLRFGNWDTYDGQFFDEWDRDLHVVSPFEIPRDWRRYFTMDYGLDMLAAYWIAVDGGGNAYVYREVYQPDLIIAAAAETIKAAENGDRADDYIAPPDMWNRKSDTGRSTAEIFAQHGIVLRKACNDRAQGWLDLKEWLHPALNEFGEKKPKLRIFSTCTELIRTLPSLVHDEGKYNDVSDRIHEYTHAPDAIRYWAAGRPCRNVPAREPDPDYPDYEDEVDAFLAYC